MNLQRDDSDTDRDLRLPRPESESLNRARAIVGPYIVTVTVLWQVVRVTSHRDGPATPVTSTPESWLQASDCFWAMGRVESHGPLIA
jgi:hypothetical protein